MGLKLFLVLFFHFVPVLLSLDSENITIVIKEGASIAKIDESFICATMDWWPPEKCSYGRCPWGKASIQDLDLNHPVLLKAIKAFDPLRIRVGGTLQDRVVYDVGSFKEECVPFSTSSSELFGFSTGCLSMEKWDQLNNLFSKTGALATFGLNALYGKKKGSLGVWEGDWNSTNSRELMEYTISKGYNVNAWELGNELSGSGIGARIESKQYASDLIALKTIINELYKSSKSKPLLVAPGGFFSDPKWYAQFLQDSGPNILDAMSTHIYNLGGGDDQKIADKITDPKYLSSFENTFKAIKDTIQRYGPWSSAWVGEAGGAYNSGSPLVSNTFLNSFWYLDQLGMASKYNTQVYCRQTLVGGYYGLLERETFIPNPDYYSALLWHKLMGKAVLATDINESSFLKAYAHCRKDKSGVSLLLINLSKSTTFTTVVRNDLNVNQMKKNIKKDSKLSRNLKRTVSWIASNAAEVPLTREEYHLTGKDGDHLSRMMLLNGNLLNITENGDIPEMRPVYAAIDKPITIAPMSIAFVVFPNFEAHACATKP